MGATNGCINKSAKTDSKGKVTGLLPGVTPEMALERLE